MWGFQKYYCDYVSICKHLHFLVNMSMIMCHLFVVFVVLQRYTFMTLHAKTEMTSDKIGHIRLYVFC